MQLKMVRDYVKQSMQEVDHSIGSTTSTRRLSSGGKFGRGEAEAKLSQGG